MAGRITLKNAEEQSSEEVSKFLGQNLLQEVIPIGEYLSFIPLFILRLLRFVLSLTSHLFPYLPASCSLKPRGARE